MSKTNPIHDRFNRETEVSKEMSADPDELVFQDEEEVHEAAPSGEKVWKIIIADDEEEVHNITRMVLADYIFDGKSIVFFSAYTGEQTKKLIMEHPDTAVILLDVVMETDDAGLEVARYIRKDLKNDLVRIVLRTGQPGKAPEREIITGYDINDYKEKTELTAQKLFTTVTSVLRGYRDLRIIEKNRKGLEQIINSSKALFEVQSFGNFVKGILTQLISLLQIDENSFFMKTYGFTALKDNDDFVILAATGKFEHAVGKYVGEVFSEEVVKTLVEVVHSQKSMFLGDAYVGYFPTRNGAKNLLYLTGCGQLSELDKDLIRIFSTNVAVAFENVYLNKEIVDTQKELIITLGEVLENRSKEAVNHVRRVAEFSYLLAVKAGLGQEEAELIRIVAPMHDVGKVGIPDSILFKPDKLLTDEFDLIKLHTVIGFDILKNSDRKIMESAAIVAHQHHERWDGKGYPQGLKGDDIHIYGRIASLADVFDALTHKRIYKDAWEIDRVVSYIKEESGKHFDPGLVQIFLDNLEEFVSINSAHPD